MTTISPQTRVSSGSAYVDYADGLASHGESFFYMPGDFVNYMLGVDSHWAERRSFFANVFRNYGSLSDGLQRPVHIVNGLAIGGFNFLTVGTLHTDTEFLRELSVFVFRNHPTAASLCNQFFRTAESYMNPSPRNAYEFGQWSFDTVAAVAGYKAMVEFKAWSDPISQRTAVMAEVNAIYRQSLMAWVAELGGGEVAIAKLREMTTRLPSLAEKNIPLQLEQGDRAMAALSMLSRQYPQATAWMQNPLELGAIADRLTETHAGIVQSAQVRMLIAAQHAPEGAINAVMGSLLNRLQDPFMETAMLQSIDHSATPHFVLLQRWAADAALSPTVLKAYEIISMHSEGFVVSTRAAEAIARMLPKSQSVVVELLSDQNALTRYGMMRALMRQHSANPKSVPPELVTRLQKFSLSEHMILVGKEATTGDAHALLLNAVALGNESALHLAESMLEISHPYATIGVLRRIRTQMPHHAERISTFLKTVDPSIIENDVVFHSIEDPFMSSQNVRLLMALAKEGNTVAKDAILRLSLHERPAVMDVATACLADMAEAGALTADEVNALVHTPGPRLLQLMTYAVLKNATTVKIQWHSFGQAVLAVKEFPQAALQVLRYYARLKDPDVGYAVGQFMDVAGKSQRDLIAILREFPEARQTVSWNHLADVVNATLDDIGLQLDAVKLMDEVGEAAAVPLETYNVSWFEGAANSGDVRGLAGLETLALNGNRTAVAALKRLSAQRHSRDQLFNMPLAARKALDNLAPEARAGDGVKLEPTVQLQVTQLDIQNGIAASLARDIMAGSRVLKSLRELEVLRKGVEQGVQGPLDAIYKIAWQKSEFSAEAREVLLRWDAVSDAPHPATVHIMVRVLSQEAPAVESIAQPAAMVVLRSMRHLESLITVSSEYGGMAMEELLRQLRRNPDELTAAVRRLLASNDPRVLDLVVNRLVVTAGQGRVDITVLRGVLEGESSSLGKSALQNRLALELLTARQSNPLEQLRSFIP